MSLIGSDEVFAVNETIRGIPAELVSYDAFQGDFRIDKSNRFHALAPCGSCGRVRIAHVNVLFPEGKAQGKTELTRRQSEILQYLADGMTTKAIAEALVISESTVKTTTTAIYRRLGAHNRVQAIAKAQAQGHLR